MRNKRIWRILTSFIFILCLLLALSSCTKTYTVTFDSNGGSAVESQKIEEGGYATEPTAPLREGFTFLGWYHDNDKWDFSHYVVNENTTLKAKWQENYTVTFDSNGGSAVESQTRLSGSLVSRPTSPTREGYTFMGWYYGEDEWNFEETPLESNITLVAVWTINRHVTFDSNGSELIIDSLTLLDGSLIPTPPSPTLSGHSFLGWYFGDELWDFSSRKVTEDITLVAKWAVGRLVTFNSNGGESVPSVIVVDGSKLTAPPEPSYPDYSFLGWYHGDVLWDFDNNVVSSDIILTARWKGNFYTVTFNTNGAPAIPSQKVSIGACATEPPIPEKEGHIFLGWYLDETPWNFSVNKVPANIVLTAKWIASISVTFDSDGGSPVDAQGLMSGASASLPPNPIKDGFIFDGWYLGDSATAWDFSTLIYESITLKARWTPIYTVTFNSDGGTSADIQFIVAGQHAVKPQNPQKGNYVFKYWAYEGREWNFETDTVQSNITLTAVYYAPVYISFNTGCDTLIPSQEIPYGATASLPEVSLTKNHHVFKCWTYSGAEWNFSTPVYQNIELVASWEFIGAVITLDTNGGVPMEAKIVDKGEKIGNNLIGFPTRAGYSFEGWYIKGTNIKLTAASEYTVTEDIVLVARWVEGNGMGGGTMGGDQPF